MAYKGQKRGKIRQSHLQPTAQRLAALRNSYDGQMELDPQLLAQAEAAASELYGQGAGLAKTAHSTRSSLASVISHAIIAEQKTSRSVAQQGSFNHLLEVDEMNTGIYSEEI